MALATALMLGAVELTPATTLATPPLSAVIVAGHPDPGSLPAASPLPATADSAALERAVVSRFADRPLTRLLAPRTRDPRIAARIARAIVKEASLIKVAPSLLTAVLLTENPRLETTTVSSQGAIGLMQVMHFHAGAYDCASDDLLQVEANICHGARVFDSYLRRTGNVQRALLRYNGCVASANTPNCYRYPAKVISTARQVRRQLLQYPIGYRPDRLRPLDR